MLGGRVAGIISTQGRGEPGKNISDFWIRGIGTFGANASALVLIDGLEGSLNDVDPDVYKRQEVYSSLPRKVREFLSGLPTAWDDTKLLCGYPGTDIVLARRKGDVWYIGGLNLSLIHI